MVSASLAAVALAPAVLTRLPLPLRNHADRVIPWLIASLVAMELVHDLAGAQPVLVAAAFLFGWFGPTLLERGVAQLREPTHAGTLLIAVIGLCVHSMGDGTLLRQAHEAPLVAAAIVLHGLPVGIGAWWLVAPAFGTRRGVFTLALLCASTVIGFVAGQAVRGVFDGEQWALFTAFVGGSLMHVAFGSRHIDHAHDAADAESSHREG